MFGFRKGMKKFKLGEMFPVAFYTGEEGAPAGADSGATAVAEAPAVSDLPGVSSGVPKDFAEKMVENDPEYQELLRQEASLNKKGKDSEVPEEDISGEQGLDKGEEDTTEGAKVDEKVSDTATEEVEEFADDVIPGLKGEHFKTLPQEAKLAVAEFHAKADAASKENEVLRKRVEALTSDPIIRDREEMLKQGRTQYDVKGMSPEEYAGLRTKIQAKIGVDQADAEAVLSEVEDLIKTRSRDMADDISKNIVLEETRRKQVDEITAKGRNIFLQLGKFNKALAFKETDANNLWKKDVNGQWVSNEAHPEFKAYSEKILPVVNALGKANMNYEQLIKLSEDFGLEAVYALVAKKLGLSVAINTKERDNKMIGEEVRNRLRPFMKGATSDELRPGTGKSPTVSPIIKNGYDITKLATDNDYRDRAISAKTGDMTHFKLIERLTDEGDAYLSKKKK